MVVMLLGVPASSAATHGRLITDAAYSIRFYLPTAWKHPIVTTSTSASTKLLVQDVSGATVVGLVQVQVIPGRHTNASQIASGLLSSTAGAKVLGSRIVKFPFGKVEQLRFSVKTSLVLVEGMADSFYARGRTYVVAFDSAHTRINAVAQAAVMHSWQN